MPLSELASYSRREGSSEGKGPLKGRVLCVDTLEGWHCTRVELLALLLGRGLVLERLRLLQSIGSTIDHHAENRIRIDHRAET